MASLNPGTDGCAVTEVRATPSDRDEIAARWQQVGFPAHQVAALAVAAKWSPIDIIKMLKLRYGVPIGEGKQLVDSLLPEDVRKVAEYVRYLAEFVAHLPADTTEAEVDRLDAAVGLSRKLRALIDADRSAEAAATLARFDPSARTFPPLSLMEAIALVTAEIDTWPHPMVLLEELTETYDFGWTFICHSAAFAQSRDMRDLVVGHGPILVDKFTGVVWMTGSAPLDHVSNYRETGNPHVAPDSSEAVRS